MPHTKTESRGCANQPMAVRAGLSLHTCSLHMAEEGTTPKIVKPPDLRASHFIPFSLQVSLRVFHDAIKMPRSKDFSRNCIQRRSCSLTADLILAWTSNSEEAKLFVPLHMDNTSLIPSGFAFSSSKPPKHSVCRQKLFSPLLLENC